MTHHDYWGWLVWLVACLWPLSLGAFDDTVTGCKLPTVVLSNRSLGYADFNRHGAQCKTASGAAASDTNTLPEQFHFTRVRTFPSAQASGAPSPATAILVLLCGGAKAAGTQLGLLKARFHTWHRFLLGPHGVVLILASDTPDMRRKAKAALSLRAATPPCDIPWNSLDTGYEFLEHHAGGMTSYVLLTYVALPVPQWVAVQNRTNDHMRGWSTRVYYYNYILCNNWYYFDGLRLQVNVLSPGLGLGGGDV